MPTTIANSTFLDAFGANLCTPQQLAPAIVDPLGFRRDDAGKRRLGEAMIGCWSKRAFVGAALAFLAVSGGTAPARAQGAIGLIYMTGKQSPTNTAGSGDIAAKAQSAGIKVIVPSMPWGQGGWEKISVTPEQVFTMIDGYANQLRAQGAQRIVVGGQSLGANVALAYAAARRNVAGVVMAAPGHNPGGSYNRVPAIKEAIERACELTKSGQGNQSFTGQDENQGSSIRVSTTAAVYCAWMNPRGLASMPVQARELPANIPVMLIIGTRDPSFGFAENNIYKPAAKNPYSRYLVIDGGEHRNTDHSASQRIVDWIKGLP